MDPSLFTLPPKDVPPVPKTQFYLPLKRRIWKIYEGYLIFSLPLKRTSWFYVPTQGGSVRCQDLPTLCTGLAERLAGHTSLITKRSEAWNRIEASDRKSIWVTDHLDQILGHQLYTLFELLSILNILFYTYKKRVKRRAATCKRDYPPGQDIGAADEKFPNNILYR